MKQEIKLNRTDRRPLVFMGEEMLETSTKTESGPTSTRWTTVRVFSTDNGYIIGIAHITLWDTERNTYIVAKSKSLKGVISAVGRMAPALQESTIQALFPNPKEQHAATTINDHS